MNRMNRTVRTVAALAVGLAALIGLVVAGWVLLNDDVPEQADPWNYYRPTADGIEVFKIMGHCDEIVGAEVTEETTERVVVAIYVVNETLGYCTMESVDVAVTVDLQAPLNDRPVYDAACLAGSTPENQCERERQ